MTFACRSCRTPFPSPKARASHERVHLRSTADRLWAKADRNGPVPAHLPELGRCWIWTGHTVDGYGRIVVDGVAQGAHRVALSLILGRPIATDMQALHHCDNPPCVNPAHIFEGTGDDNVADRHAKGRDARGEADGRARLTETDVRRIRSHLTRGESWSRVARRFGVSKGTVQAIAAGRTWQHVI